MTKPILANRLYVPERLVPSSVLREYIHVWYERLYEPVLDEEGLVVLDDNGRQKTERQDIKHVIEAHHHLLTGQQEDWIGFPRGDWDPIRKPARHAIDLRTLNPWDFPLHVAAHVVEDDRFPAQAKCVDAWCRQGTGLIIGQTGAGKTIMGIDATCRMRLETLIVSKRGEGEGHWEEEFRQHTNINLLEKQLGHRLIGPYRHRSKQYPISIATVQTFLHKKGYQRLINDQFRFGLVIADEVHELVAPEFIRVFSLWAPLSWLGLTATPKRPDHREFLAYKILGPIAARLGADQMRPKVEFIETTFQVPDWMEGRKNFSRQFKWGRLLKLISENETRIALIVGRVMEDLDNERLVAVVGERTKLLRSIQNELTRNGYEVGYADGTVPKNARKKIYEKMSRRSLQCLCAGKVLDAMVSIKPLDCLHVVTPVAAEHRVKQIFGRARRVDEGKLVPLVRYYADRGGQLSGAMRSALRVCEDEGWEIKKTPVALAVRRAMGRWKPKR